MRTVLLALLTGLAIVSASGPVQGACSARGLPALAAQPTLPKAVAAMRTAIAEAARRCDYERLGRLGLTGKRPFVYDWEDHGRPATFWRRQEAAGKPYLATMVALLTLPPSTGWPTGGYTWVDLTTHPRPSRAAFLKVKVVPDYHLTILKDGDWLEMVIGD